MHIEHQKVQTALAKTSFLARLGSPWLPEYTTVEILPEKNHELPEELLENLLKLAQEAQK